MQTLFTGDPSTTVQYFPRVSIKIHCCRYWWLKNWEYSTLSFPFWRIYHNTGVATSTSEILNIGLAITSSVCESLNCRVIPTMAL